MEKAQFSTLLLLGTLEAIKWGKILIARRAFLSWTDKSEVIKQVIAIILIIKKTAVGLINSLTNV